MGGQGPSIMCISGSFRASQPPPRCTQAHVHACMCIAARPTFRSRRCGASRTGRADAPNSPAGLRWMPLLLYIYFFLPLSLSLYLSILSLSLLCNSSDRNRIVTGMRMKTWQFCRGIWHPTVLMILLAAPRMVLAARPRQLRQVVRSSAPAMELP